MDEFDFNETTGVGTIVTPAGITAVENDIGETEIFVAYQVEVDRVGDNNAQDTFYAEGDIIDAAFDPANDNTVQIVDIV